MRRALWGRAFVVLSGTAGALVGLLFHATRSPAQGALVDAPQGTVIYTRSASCPSGWVAATSVEGRLVVGTETSANVGSTVGSAMPVDQAPVHAHNVTVSVTLPSKNLSQGALAGRPRPGASGTYMVTDQSTLEHSGAPLLQLRACRKP